MNTELKENGKMILKKLLENLWKTCKNGSKRELFGVRNKLLYNFFFLENLRTTEMRKTNINEPV